MEFKWQYVWVATVFTGVLLGGHAYFTEQAGKAYIIPFALVIVAVIGKLLTDE